MGSQMVWGNKSTSFLLIIFEELGAHWSHGRRHMQRLEPGFIEHTLEKDLYWTESKELQAGKSNGLSPRFTFSDKTGYINHALKNWLQLPARLNWLTQEKELRKHNNQVQVGIILSSGPWCVFCPENNKCTPSHSKLLTKHNTRNNV